MPNFQKTNKKGEKLMTSYRKSFLELMVDVGHSTEAIMKWKDYWDWQEVTEEDINQKIKKLKGEN